MSNKKIYIILNPASGGGKAERKKGKLLRELKFYFGDSFTYSETTNEVDATSLSRKAIKAGYETIVAVGGDGTANQVINGFFNNEISINPNVKLGVIGFGTGQGFVQSIGLPSDLSSQIRVIKDNHIKIIDLGKIIFNNGFSSKYFLNEFQFGIGAFLSKTISPRTKKNLGRFAFGFEAVKSLLNYQAEELELFIDGKPINKKVIGVVVANGAFTGGGMRLTPDALLDDGLLDVLIIEDMPINKRIISFSKVYSGKHLELEPFQLYKANRIECKYRNGLLIESDGELINSKCVAVEVLPAFLNVISNN